jgi:hypothetical protein
MLSLNKITLKIFFYLVGSFFAISLVSFVAEKYESSLVLKLVTESALGATQQEAVDKLLTMPGNEVRNKIEKLVIAVAVVKLGINICILYLTSCLIVKRFNSNLSEMDAPHNRGQNE